MRPRREWTSVRCRSATCLPLFATEGGRALFRLSDDGVCSIKIKGVSFVFDRAPVLVVCRCETVWRNPDPEVLARLGVPADCQTA